MSYESLEWDSAFFGFAIGRIGESPAGAVDLRRSVADADADAVRCLYFLCPAGNDAALEEALDLGFRPYDVRVEFERELGAPGGEPAAVREALPSEAASLEGIARSRLRGTRFWNDRHFERSRIADLYVEWLRRSLDAAPERLTLVVGDAAGFVTCRFDPANAIGTVELIVVAEGEEGRGLGRQLLTGADEAFAAAGMRRAAVVTQARNVAAQRLYQGCGYRTTRVALWLHRWSA